MEVTPEVLAAAIATSVNASMAKVYAMRQSDNLDLTALLSQVQSEGDPSALAALDPSPVVHLTMSDVLSLPAQNGVHQLVLSGTVNDKLMLSKDEWTDTGAVVNQDGHTYAVFAGSTMNKVPKRPVAMMFSSVSSRLLPGASGTSSDCASNTLTKPASPPRGDASICPLASLLANTTNGDKAMKRTACASSDGISFLSDRSRAGPYSSRRASRVVMCGVVMAYAALRTMSMCMDE